MKIGYNVLKNSCDFYDQVLPSFCKVAKSMGEIFPNCSGRYYTNYIEMCSGLKKIAKEYLGLLDACYAKNIDKLFDEFEQPTTKKKRKPKVKPQNINTQVPASSIKKNESSDADSPLTVKAVYIEEGDEDEIQEELNILMEVMRRICEEGRAKKIKEQKAKRDQKILARKAQAMEENEVVSVIVRKLNTDQITLFKQIFLTNPPHGVITKIEITKLVEDLGGFVVGVDGSKFRIYWIGEKIELDEKKQPEKKMQGGNFEIAHKTNVPDGTLKSGWVKRVAEAIRRGMVHGLIVVDPSTGIKWDNQKEIVIFE